MSEMIERVAGAIDAAYRTYGGSEVVNLREVARAAIEAMRDPTPDMSTDGKHAVKGCESTFERDIAETAYRVMIDAALKAP